MKQASIKSRLIWGLFFIIFASQWSLSLLERGTSEIPQGRNMHRDCTRHYCRDTVIAEHPPPSQAQPQLAMAAEDRVEYI